MYIHLDYDYSLIDFISPEQYRIYNNEVFVKTRTSREFFRIIPEDISTPRLNLSRGLKFKREFMPKTSCYANFEIFWNYNLFLRINSKDSISLRRFYYSRSSNRSRIDSSDFRVHAR